MPNIEVTSIYYFFKQKLRQNFTEPPGAPDLAQFHLIDMYTRSTHLSVKDKFWIDSHPPHICALLLPL